MRLWIAAGEASGDRLAAELVEALRRRGPVEACGLAGPAMRRAGVRAVARAEEATAVGLVEAARRVPSLMALSRRITEAALDWRPQVAVTVDSPGLLLRHARALRGGGIPVAHWVAPQVWAWRPGRAARLHEAVDTLMCLLPFEPAWFHRYGVRAVFTGHPRSVPCIASSSEEAPVVVLAPGSRPSELERLVPVMRAVAERLQQAWPEVRFRVPVAPTLGRVDGLPGERVASMQQAARGARAALVASGTATLELAALGVPMVVLYAVHPATWWAGRALVRGVRHLALPNVLAGREIVPEHLQHLDPEAIAADLLALRADAGQKQRRALAEVLRGLCGEGAVERAADEVLGLVRGGRDGTPGRSRSS